MRKLQQFSVIKIPTNLLKRKSYNLNLSLEESRRSGLVVSLGDSQLLRSLRKLKGIEFSQDNLNSLLEEKRKLKRKKSSSDNIHLLLELERQIDDIIFVPEIVSIQVDNISHYSYLGQNGFFLNNVHFSRLMCGAGQARRNNALFIEDRYEKELKEILNNGRDESVEITPNKFNAYFSLASSSSLSVSFPYFCVVPDKEIVREEIVDFVEEVENSDDIVTRKSVPITFNLWDGQGIISPRKAKEWALELGLDYIPSNFIIRSNFIKGMLAVIDFNKYSDEIGDHFITDIWGEKVNIRDMDVILTASQFKLHSSFSSCQEYILNCRKNDLGWSVTRVTPKVQDDHCYTNYQFLQVTNLNDDAIKRLCQKTVDFFDKITKGDIRYTLLYLLGSKTETFDPNILEKLQDVATKSLIFRNDLLDDPYIKSHIFSSLNKKIKESYTGTLLIDGNYQIMAADPYAFLESIFDQPIKGLLNRNEHYSKYWLDKGEDIISAMRAPLTVPSEILTLHLKEDDRIKDYYRYLDGCIVFNVFGNDCLLAGGADFDGDIICTTNNEDILYGSQGGVPVHYETRKAKKEKIIENVLYLADIKAFNTQVGRITNTATTAFALLPILEKDSPEYLETMKRIILFRKLQGAQIDAAKGLIIKPFPSHWTRWTRVLETMPEEEKNRLNFLNSIILDKRPAFMRFIYSTYNKKFLNYNKDKNDSAIFNFGKTLNSLLESKDLTEEQQCFIDSYHKYSLFLETPCLMNKISWYMQEKVKELKISLNEKNNTIDIIKDNDIPTDPEKLKQIYFLYEKYRSQKRNFNSIMDDDNFPKYKSLDQFARAIRQEGYSISSDGSELANLSVDICYTAKNADNKNFCWSVFGQEILENVKKNRQDKIFVPVKDPKGGIEYLGSHYRMQEIQIEKDDFDYEQYL